MFFFFSCIIYKVDFLLLQNVMFCLISGSELSLWHFWSWGYMYCLLFWNRRNFRFWVFMIFLLLDPNSDGGRSYQASTIYKVLCWLVTMLLMISFHDEMRWVELGHVTLLCTGFSWLEAFLPFWTDMLFLSSLLCTIPEGWRKAVLNILIRIDV